MLGSHRSSLPPTHIGAPSPPEIRARTMRGDIESLLHAGGGIVPESLRPVEGTEAVHFGEHEEIKSARPHTFLIIAGLILVFLALASFIIYFFILPYIAERP